MNKSEKNYPMLQKELLDIVASIKKFEYYLAGREFELLTDHQALIYLDKIGSHQGRVARCSLYLSQFKFKMHYVAGTSRVIAPADTLTRMEEDKQEVFRGEISEIDKRKELLKKFHKCCWFGNVKATTKVKR